MEVIIQIPAENNENAQELLGNDFCDYEFYAIHNNPDIYIRIVQKQSRQAFPGKEVVVILVEYAGAIAAGIIASWLYDKLKGKCKTITIGNKNVDIDDTKKLKKLIKQQSTRKLSDRS